MELIYRNKLILVIAALLALSCSRHEKDMILEDSWYSYMHDQQNSGISKESLSFPLHLSWKRKMMHAPQPAWPAPAKEDFYNQKGTLEPLVTYDRAFHPIVVQGKLFIASSANDMISCFDAHTGEKIWQFFTDGPNRNAPLWHRGKVYFGSDDGNLYCLTAENGNLIWKKNFGNDRKLVGNGRVISAAPIRTGVVAKGDTVFVTSGLLPEESVSIHACDALTGESFWEQQLTDLAPQGYPVLSDSLWYVPNSRVQPMAFHLETGKLSHRLNGFGGTYQSMIDGKLIHGINWQGEIRAQNFLKASMTGYKVIGQAKRLYIASEFSLTAIDVNAYLEAFTKKELLENELKELAELIKKKPGSYIAKVDSVKKEIDKAKSAEFLWQKEVPKSFGMIKTKNTVIVGLQNMVMAFDAETGQEKWQMPVEGRAYGLAVCANRLYVSTDQGVLYCFGKEKGAREFIDEADGNYFSSAKGREQAMSKANTIKKHLPRERGLLLVLNADEGDLVSNLSQTCDYYILGVEEDEKKVLKAREQLNEAGVYGMRTAIFQGKLDEVQLSDYLINVVVMDKGNAKSELNSYAEQISKILSPSGGRLLVPKELPEEEITAQLNAHFKGYSLSGTEDYWILEREVLPESGEWTHLYANPSNTVSTGDRYASDKARPLWFGQPGPREMSDRHHRAPAPMYKNGVLIIPKDNGVIAADAYNGTLLWEKDIPHFRRIKISRDAGNLALSDDYLYAVAENYCYAIDVTTGVEKNMMRVPQERGPENAHWGYLALEENMLYGSGRKFSAIFNEYSRLDWSERSRLVTSDYLFGIDKQSGKTAWTYKGGVILNPSICLGEGKLFFVESTNKDAVQDEDGLIQFNVLKKELNIVALNSLTGAVIWKKAYDFRLLEHIMFGSYADGVLIMSGSGNKKGSLWYGTYAFDANTGSLLWDQSRQHLKWTNGSHGEQIHRAVIMDKTVYIEPFAFDLQTGIQKEGWKLQRNGHSCGTISGANDVLFFRGTNPSACIPDKTDQGVKLNASSRPGCWINIIPAGGLILIPEASSGCSCNFPLQMSIVYQPV